MSGNDQQPRGPFVGCFAAAILLLPIAYVLSTGPLLVLVLKGFLAVETFELIYWPLSKLYDHWQPAKGFFDWYLKLFGRSP
jgi:hypothetical protein